MLHTVESCDSVSTLMRVNGLSTESILSTAHRTSMELRRIHSFQNNNNRDSSWMLRGPCNIPNARKYKSSEDWP
jgi:hypothetical protein